MAIQTSTETQIAVALEVLKMDETGKTKSDIAKEFNVSPRSVSRYADKYEDEAMDLYTNHEENVELETAFAPTEEKVEETVESEKEELETLKEQFEAADGINQELDADDIDRLEELEEKLATELEAVNEEEPVKEEKVAKVKKAEPKTEDEVTTDRRGRRGRTPKGVASIKSQVLEILTKARDENKLTKSNRETLIADIMEATGHDKKQASKYFAGYKKIVGDYQEEQS